MNQVELDAVGLSAKVNEALSLVVPAEGLELFQYAARSRALELITLCNVLDDKPNTWHPSLRSLSRAIDDTIKALHAKNHAVIKAAPNDSYFDEVLAEREEIDGLLTQTRIAALCLLANINAVVQKQS